MAQRLKHMPFIAATLALSAATQPVRAQTPTEILPENVRTYTVYRTPSEIVVDGSIDEAAWEAAPWTSSFVDIRDDSYPAPTWETRAKLLWDDRYLYVAAYLVEPHLWATLTQRDAIIYRDNDFEVFLDPEGDAVGYYEFEINALGTMFDLYLNLPYNEGGTAAIIWDAFALKSAVRLDGTLNDPSDEDLGWSVELAIPFESLRPPNSQTLGVRPNDRDNWRVNFSRVQWPLNNFEGRYSKVREPVDFNDHPEDNWVWSPQGTINMHIPEHWGVITFRTIPPPAPPPPPRGNDK